MDNFLADWLPYNLINHEVEQVLNAKPILDRWLNEDDYWALGQAVVNAYKGCDEFMSTSAVFSEFALGREHRSDLLGIFVQYALNSIPLIQKDFYQELKANAARNCFHVRLHKNGLVLTSHFVGRKNFRKGARPAICRASLATSMDDLFAAESNDLDICNKAGFAYSHLLHGGVDTPDVSMLAIPSRDQLQIIAACDLPRPEPQAAKSEDITDKIVLLLRRQTHEIENSDAEQAG